MSLLSVIDLGIRYAESPVAAVEGLSFSIEPGEAVGLVGESGSGKTQTALAIMGLLPANAQVAGSIRFAGKEIVGAGDAALRDIRARKIAMVFQDPGLSLNPYLRIGEQLKRIVIEHGIADGEDAQARALEMLGRVGLPDAARQFRAYPHQLSGGMRQRVMIGSALIAEPDLLIADEPTTALDVTIQAQILHLLRELRDTSNTAMLLITHDLGVIAGNSERLLVMQDGRLIEQGTTRQVFAAPATAATSEMVAAGHRSGIYLRRQPDSDTVLQADGVAVSFPHRDGMKKQQLEAVLPLSFSLSRGETLAIVGESGAGKSSLARAIVGLLPTYDGSVSFLGNRLRRPVQARPRATLRQMQMVFQDPLASLNPAMRVAAIVSEPLWVHEPGVSTEERYSAVLQALADVGLDESLIDRFPHELSGGQAQRVAIARALIVKPSVLVCDEAVAALDNTVKRDVLGLLRQQQDKTALSLMFISHDLGIVREISDRVVVMYMGRIAETATTEQLFERPRHPYTRALIDAIPKADPSVVPAEPAIAGEVASLMHPPAGCVFHPRCKYAVETCSMKPPELSGEPPGQVACLRARELDLARSGADSIGGS